MARFEPWRLQELAILLDELIITLRTGKNPEWASVFGHFGHELEFIASIKTGERDELSRLILNIQSCLSEGSGISRLILEGENAEESGALNQRFAHLKTRLRKALDDIQEKLVEVVN
jgi:hypothetical protein